MILASSSFSSHSKRTPLSAPCLPTGIKTGVSITERLVVSRPARALPSRAVTCQSMAVAVAVSILFTDERPDIVGADGGLGEEPAVLVDEDSRRGAKHTERT